MQCGKLSLQIFKVQNELITAFNFPTMNQIYSCKQGNSGDLGHAKHATAEHHG